MGFGFFSFGGETGDYCIAIVYFQDEAVPNSISHFKIMLTYNRPLNFLQEESVHKKNMMQVRENLCFSDLPCCLWS